MARVVGNTKKKEKKKDKTLKQSKMHIKDDKRGGRWYTK
jgi:hypothetical protein